jgi:hypothetical protein
MKLLAIGKVVAVIGAIALGVLCAPPVMRAVVAEVLPPGHPLVTSGRSEVFVAWGYFVVALGACGGLAAGFACYFHRISVWARLGAVLLPMVLAGYLVMRVKGMQIEGAVRQADEMGLKPLIMTEAIGLWMVPAGAFIGGLLGVGGVIWVRWNRGKG